MYMYMYMHKYTNIQTYIYIYTCYFSSALDMMSSPEAELKGHRQNFLVPASLSPEAAICW